MKIKEWIKNNYTLLIVLLLYLIISILAVKELGFDYTINSDDLSYINSGITFFKEGIITMHGVISAQIMPGLTFLIAFFCCFFKTGSMLIISLKIFYIIMFLITIIYLYKTIRLYTNQYIASICSFCLLTPDFIWTNNLILTETPYILFQMMLIYYSLKLVKDNSWISYIMIVISYICALFIRPTIALYPLFLFIYLLLNKYDFKKMIIQGLIALSILLCLLVPWTIRNYKEFNSFIPLTYGMGNPLLLGTYQGYNYPLDEELDYDIVYEKLDEKVKNNLENKEENSKLARYYSLEYDGIKAKYRMQEWWNKDKISMLKSYLIFKPKILLVTTFYWEEIFNISENLIVLFHKIELCICGILCLFMIFMKKYYKELILLLGFYIYNILLYSYSFAYGRYALALYPIRFIIIGLGIKVMIDYLKNRRFKIEKN